MSPLACIINAAVLGHHLHVSTCGHTRSVCSLTLLIVLESLLLEPVYTTMLCVVMLIVRLNRAISRACGQEMNECITPWAEAMSFTGPSDPPGARSAPPQSHVEI